MLEQSFASTITTKGQITLPKPIREHLHVDTGQRLHFLIQKTGNVLIKPKKDIRELAGFLKPFIKNKRKKAPTIEEMNEAVKKRAAEDDKRIRRQYARS